MIINGQHVHIPNLIHPFQDSDERPQPIMEFLEFEVDHVRYREWKTWIEFGRKPNLGHAD